MNPIDELVLEFRKTFEDKLLTKAERQGLQIAIANAVLDQRKRDILRSKVFEIARGGLGAEAYFTLEWLEAASRLLEAKDEPQESRGQSGSHVFFSPGEDCLNALVSKIRAAVKTLDICVFTISDDRITDAIIERHRRGLKVRIITDNEKLHDAGSDIERLHRAGIEIRVDMTEYHMHHKFALSDKRQVVTGSYNWTRSAAAYNEENILVTDEASVVRSFGEEFERMWERMVPFQ